MRRLLLVLLLLVGSTTALADTCRYATRRDPNGYYWYNGKAYRNIHKERYYNKKLRQWRTRVYYRNRVYGAKYPTIEITFSNAGKAAQDLDEFHDEDRFALEAIRQAGEMRELNTRRYWQGQLALVKSYVRSKLVNDLGLNMMAPGMDARWQTIQPGFSPQGLSQQYQQNFNGQALQSQAYGGRSPMVSRRKDVLDLFNTRKMDQILATRLATGAEHQDNMQDKLLSFLIQYLTSRGMLQEKGVGQMMEVEKFLAQAARDETILAKFIEAIEASDIPTSRHTTDTTTSQESPPPAPSLPPAPRQPPNGDRTGGANFGPQSMQLVFDRCASCHSQGEQVAMDTGLVLDGTVKLTDEQALACEYAVRLSLGKVSPEELKALGIETKPMPPPDSGKPGISEAEFGTFRENLFNMTKGPLR